jgi:hypothetical protein
MVFLALAIVVLPRLENGIGVCRPSWSQRPGAYGTGNAATPPLFRGILLRNIVVERAARPSFPHGRCAAGAVVKVRFRR